MLQGKTFLDVSTGRIYLHVNKEVTFIINEKSKLLSTEELMSQHGLRTSPIQKEVMNGGDSNYERVFIIHNRFGHYKTNHAIGTQYVYSDTLDILKDIARNDYFTKYIVCLGHETDFEDEIIYNPHMIEIFPEDIFNINDISYFK